MDWLLWKLNFRICWNVSSVLWDYKTLRSQSYWFERIGNWEEFWFSISRCSLSPCSSHESLNTFQIGTSENDRKVVSHQLNILKCMLCVFCNILGFKVENIFQYFHFSFRGRLERFKNSILCNLPHFDCLDTRTYDHNIYISCNSTPHPTTIVNAMNNFTSHRGEFHLNSSLSIFENFRHGIPLFTSVILSRLRRQKPFLQ